MLKIISRTPKFDEAIQKYSFPVPTTDAISSDDIDLWKYAAVLMWGASNNQTEWSEDPIPWDES